MAQQINTNMAALSVQRNLSKSTSKLAVSLERISSGLRINTAKDDSAGLSISTRMSTQIRGSNIALRNANDAVSLSQTAESALDEISNALQRMREIAIQSANETNSLSNRTSLQAEVTQLRKEIDRIANTTMFNQKKILDNETTPLNFHIGANAGESISIDSINATTSFLGSPPGFVQSTGIRVAVESPTDSGTQGISENTYGQSLNHLIVRKKDVPSIDAINIASPIYGGVLVSPNTFELLDRNSPNYGTGFAKQIAIRINSIRASEATSMQGIYAKAETSFSSKDITDGDSSANINSEKATNIGQGTIANGDLVINGVDIPPATFRFNDSDKSLISAINSKRDITGVTASIDSNGELNLHAEDGRDIIISTSTISVTNSIFGGGNDLSQPRFDANFSNLRIAGRLTLIADDTIVTEGSDVIRSGFSYANLHSGSTVLTTGGQPYLRPFSMTGFGNPGIDDTASGIQIGVDISSPAYSSPSLTIRKISESAGSEIDLTNPPYYVVSTTELSNPASGHYGYGLSKAIAERINTLRDFGTPQLSDVYAGAKTTFRGGILVDNDYAGTVNNASSSRVAVGTLNQGDLIINGVSVPSVNFLEGDQSGSLVNAINSIYGTTGVLASITLDGELQLSTEDGRDIVLNTSSVLTTNLVFGGGESRFDSPFNNLRIAGQLEVYSNESIIFDGLEFFAAGLDQVTETAIEAVTNEDINQLNIQAKGTIMLADVTTTYSANMLIKSVDSALNTVNGMRGNLGAIQNRLEAAMRSLSATSESLSATKSRILDANIAAESASLAQSQILRDSGIAVLAQANALPQQVLSLLNS